MQHVSIKSLKIGLLVDVRKHHRGTICQAVGSYVLLNEVYVLLEGLCLISSSNKVYLMTYYSNWNSQVDLENSIRKWEHASQVFHVFIFALIIIRARLLAIIPSLLILFLHLFLFALFRRLLLFSICKSFVVIYVHGNSLLDLVLLTYGELLDGFQDWFREQSHPAVEGVHHLPRLVKIEHYNGTGVLDVLGLQHEGEQVRLLFILKHPEVEAGEIIFRSNDTTHLACSLKL